MVQWSFNICWSLKELIQQSGTPKITLRSFILVIGLGLCFGGHDIIHGPKTAVNELNVKMVRSEHKHVLDLYYDSIQSVVDQSQKEISKVHSDNLSKTIKGANAIEDENDVSKMNFLNASNVNGSIIETCSHVPFEDIVTEHKHPNAKSSSNTSLLDCLPTQQSAVFHEDTSNVTYNRTKLYIGGLFDVRGSRGEALGLSELKAAQLAVQHINMEYVLPGYELVLLHNDTKCDPGVGMDALFDLIYRHPQMHMVIGSACSEVTKTLAEIVPYWNLILVSYASTSPALSEREKYGTFFRLAPADSSQNVPRAMFITGFGWDTVATLYESSEDNSLAIDEMGSTFEQHNITISISTSFRRLEDIRDNLLAIKQHDARIIIGGYSEKAARMVLCQAYHLGMYGPRYVWIIIGDYVERWWENTADDTGCSAEQMRTAADGYFNVDSLNSLSEDDVSSANISMNQFLSDYEEFGGKRPLSPYATSSYDTVWAAALTLKAAMQRNKCGCGMNIDSFSYSNGKNMSRNYFNIMQRLKFLGISGPISFEGPDRKGISVISQNQRGHMTRVALFDPDGKSLNFDCRTCKPINWKAGRAPRDKTVLVSRRKKIHPVAFLCVSSVSVGGLILATAFLTYNLYHRKLRYIKLSSPNLNNMAVVGCMLVYSGIIVLGYDDSDLDQRLFPYWCTARAFLFASGFSMAFGAMFTKTYRVHQIFTRANRGLIKSKLLRDKQLLFIVGALLVVDSLVLLVWVIVDPMRKHVTDLTTETADDDDDLLFISQLTTCHSKHLDKWTGGLYAYKGLLLIFGVYMAWETRNVNIPALNDSRYIGMNVYNVVMMSVLVVALSNILSHQPTLAYVLESSFMLISTTITLCLLFVPKIYAILTSKGDPVIAASGITVDANCRRFAVDEKRDLFYRAEVQNRVYKREIVKLDQEIVRLERLIELPMEPYPRLTKELLFLLPESRVDPSPTLKRRWGQEKDMCTSISDAGDICMGVSEERSDDAIDHYCTQQETSCPPTAPLRHRATRLSIRVTNYAYSKLCKLKPRFSVGNVIFKPDYEDLKTSPTVSPEDQIDFLSLKKKTSLHTLMRQEAVDDRKNFRGISSTHSSDKSESRTIESHISEDLETKGTECTLPPKSASVPFYLDHEFDEPCQYHTPSTPKHYFQGQKSKISSNDSEKEPISSHRRKYGNTLEVPMGLDECKISVIGGENNEPTSPKVRRARSILEHERRSRIKKLQTDLQLIQQELQDLDDLEHQVSVV